MNVYPPKILPSTKWAVYRVFQEETEEKKKKPKEKRSMKKKKSTKNKKIRKLEADEGVKPSVIDLDADGNVEKLGWAKAQTSQAIEVARLSSYICVLFNLEIH
ncbi:hypothetical protein K1719_038521 [Acacia pycnantha]|nr:hypothetical protein K1719_038521 [Acacia pycnantha]